MQLQFEAKKNTYDVGILNTYYVFSGVGNVFTKAFFLQMRD